MTSFPDLPRCFVTKFVKKKKKKESAVCISKFNCYCLKWKLRMDRILVIVLSFTRLSFRSAMVVCPVQDWTVPQHQGQVLEPGNSLLAGFISFRKAPSRSFN